MAAARALQPFVTEKEILKLEHGPQVWQCLKDMKEHKGNTLASVAEEQQASLRGDWEIPPDAWTPMDTFVLSLATELLNNKDLLTYHYLLQKADEALDQPDSFEGQTHSDNKTYVVSIASKGTPEYSKGNC